MFNVNNLFFLKKSFLKGVSQESVIVLLAFVSTALVFGFIVYNYVSSIPSYESVELSVGSLLLYYYDGSVWRVVVPVQVVGDRVVDFRPSNIRVSLSVGDGVSADFVNVSGTNSFVVLDDRVLLGDFKLLLHSSNVGVLYYDRGVVRSEYVDVHVYYDELSRIHVIIDDDNDGLMDSSYLVEFVEEAKTSVSLDLDSSNVLVVEKNTVLPISFLEYILAGSTRPDSYIKVVVSSSVYYLVSVPGLSKSLQDLAVLSMIDRGNNDYYLGKGEVGSIIILFPDYFNLRKGDRLRITIYLSNNTSIMGEFTISRDINGTGLMVLSGLKSSGEK